MSTPTITFTGTVSVEEAKRLIAEAEARPRVEEGRLYCRKNAYNPLARWRKLGSELQFSDNGGATWERSACDVGDICNGHMVPYEPEPGVVYRRVETTEQEPWSLDRWGLYRFHNGECQVKTHPEGLAPNWEKDLSATKPSSVTDDIRYGRRIPYRGYQEPPRFTVGQWVQHSDKAWTKAAQVKFNDPNTIGVSFPLATAWFKPSSLRPATDAEIVEAKQIEAKDGTLVQHKKSGNVYRCYQPRQWHGVNVAYCGPRPKECDLTTDHYDILPNYTVQGAQ